MNRELRLSMMVVGSILFCFGSYLCVIESMIERELRDLKQGTADIARIKSLAEYPFIQKDNRLA